MNKNEKKQPQARCHDPRRAGARADEADSRMDARAQDKNRIGKGDEK